MGNIKLCEWPQLSYKLNFQSQERTSKKSMKVYGMEKEQLDNFYLTMCFTVYSRGIIGGQDTKKY